MTLRKRTVWYIAYVHLDHVNIKNSKRIKSLESRVGNLPFQ